MNITSAKYQFNQNRTENDTSVIIVTSGSKTFFVPNDVDNLDYQAVLEWVADGNTIAEAD
tara:strand:+ start:339 stop:518 length:180 start_codon:yes stop_codon:yes gene_type:complete